MTMLVSDFDYHLPPELIAQRPLTRRDDSRMMVVSRRDGRILNARFRDFPEFLHRGEVLVLNNTRVIPAKAWGLKDGREAEFLFLKELDKEVWEVLCRPAKRVKLGDRIVFAPGAEAEVIETGHRGRRVLKFGGVRVRELLGRVGFAPLPPYIKRRRDQSDLRDDDLARYQTVFARREGSIAAPTAGLHFTRESLRGLKKKGVVVCPVTLDVGRATFQTVESETVEGHKMLEESYEVSAGSARILGLAKKKGRPIVAVGTTVVRTLESAWSGGAIAPGAGSTSLFITPGYEFKAVDRLLTNFHLPRSTLLMLVSAFAGVEIIREAYAEAVRGRYRFFSYGDCMLII